MPDIIDNVRIAMRRRLVPSIIAQEDFQRECYDAPTSDAYVRETVMEFSPRQEISQTGTLITVLCEYDIFVNRKTYKNVTAKISAIASDLITEFDVKNPDKLPVVLTDFPTAQANVSRVNQESIRQEAELFSLPVMVYVEVYL